ncbi:hypothetical protein FQR65_LT06932 [Abscondita terminalis]|nr:hypothetical protein FQR65_LT06932 [Abscondita terminalis]
MWFVLASVSILSALVVIYFNRSWQYWKRRNVECPRPSFPFGNVLQLMLQKQGLGELMQNFYNDFKTKKLRYGGFYFFHVPILVLIDLNLIKRIMTKDFHHFTDHSIYLNEKADPLSGHLFSLRGQKWKSVRTKLTPTFTSGKIKIMFPTLVACSGGLRKLMDENVVSRQAFDIKELVARYTTDVIGSIAFGIDCDSLNNPNSEFRNLTAPEILTFFNAKVVTKEISEFFTNVVHETVKHRETRNVQRNDFLQLLLQIKKNEGGLTMNELTAQVFSFFIAGFETSSSTLTFCFYELAQNKEVQQKLRDEINDVLRNHNFEITYDAINEMSYMDQCVNETLRKYPVVSILNRTCTETYTVPESDLIVEKGTTIEIPVLGIHRDPEIYPDPIKFDPERFSPKNKSERNLFAWLPFGEGPRMCMGMRFSMFEMKIALAVLIKDYAYTLSEKTPVPVTFNPKLLLLNVEEGVWLNVEKIDTTAFVIIMWYLLASIAIISGLAIAYFNRSWKYWKIRNVECQRPTFPFGNAKKLITQKQGIGEMMQGFYNDFKKKKLRYGGFYFLHIPNLVLVDLELIKTIMTKDFHHFTDRSIYLNEKADPLSAHLFSLKGQKWKNLRAKLTPTFTSGKMKTMFPTLVACSQGLSKLMDENVKSRQAFDIKELVARYTTDVIGSTAFGIDCDSLNNPNSEFRQYGAKIFKRTLYGTIKNLFSLIAPEILTFFNVKVLKKDISEFFMNVVNETVKYRETNDVKRNDFLQLLLQMKRNQDDLGTTRTTLTMNELAAQVFVFFIAGFETSSTTLTFCFYEMALNQEIQQKLRNEVNDVLKKHNFEMTYDAINDMTYMDKCVSETLRKYPAVSVINRTCTKTYKVPDSDLVIEKGTTIQIPVLGIQRDPEIYPDPNKFDPERFSPENKAGRHPFTWLPFGEGPRVCIGMRFGIMETKIALAALIKDYTYTLSKKTPVPLKFNPKMLLLNVEEGVWLNVEKIRNT